MIDAFISFLAELLSRWLGGDDRKQQEQNDARIAQKQAEIVADRDRPDAADRLRKHRF